jgi:tetratricopeptide (TPR) repeat protein
MTTVLLSVAFTLALVGYVAFDLKAAREYFYSTEELADGDVPFLRWWMRKNAAVFGIAGVIYLSAMLFTLVPDLALAFRTVRLNFDYLLYLLGALAVIGYLIFDLKTAHEYYHDNPDMAEEEVPFLRWWLRQNRGKFLFAVAIGGIALLMPFFGGFRFSLPSLDLPTSHPLVWIVTAAVTLYITYDLKVAHEFYYSHEELVDEETSFLRWWVRQNHLKIGVVTGIGITALGIEFVPEITYFFRGADFTPEHPERLLLALPFVGFIAYDLKTAWEFYRNDADLAGGDEPFFRWWARQHVVKISIGAGLVLSVLFLMLFPEVTAALRKADLEPDHPWLALLFLLFAGYLAYDLKTAWEFYQGVQNSDEEDEESFLRWWLRQNVLKIGIIGGLVFCGVLALLFPEIIGSLRRVRIDLAHPKLVVMALFLILALAGFLTIDLKTARKYYVDNLELSTGEIPFFRWWVRINAVKIGLSITLGMFLAVIVIFDLSAVYHITKGQITQAMTAPPKPPPKPADPNDKMASAQWYLKQKKFKEASIEYRNAIQKNPDNIEAHLALARTMMVLGNMPEAYKSYQNAVLHGPTSYPAHLELGQFALGVNAGNDPELAIQQLTLAQRLQPESVDPPLLLAHAYARLGKNDEAIENCRAALSREPTNTSARVLLVNIYLSQRSYGEALQEAEAGLKLTPEHTELSIVKASAQEALGRSAAARETLLDAAKKDPRSPAPYLYLGDMQQRLKEYTAAVTSYEEALKRSPDEAGAANNIAMLLTDHVIGQSGRERAYGLATRLYQKYPDNPLYADTLGWVLFSQGHVDQGLELLRRAAQQLPAEPQVRYHLGAALYKKGDFSGAAEELQKALTPKKEFDGVDQARNLLQLTAIKGK